MPLSLIFQNTIFLSKYQILEHFYEQFLSFSTKEENQKLFNWYKNVELNHLQLIGHMHNNSFKLDTRGISTAKYHIEKEAILLWVEMGQFPMLYIDNVPNVDEECILELFRRSKAGITAEYIDTLEQLCIDKTMVCEKYAHIIQLKEEEIQLQKEINTLINEIQAAMKRQNERIRDLKKAIGENNNVIRSDGWIKRLRKKFQ